MGLCEREDIHVQLLEAIAQFFIKQLLCVRHCTKDLTCIILFYSHNGPMVLALLSNHFMENEARSSK